MLQLDEYDELITEELKREAEAERRRRAHVRQRRRRGDHLPRADRQDQVVHDLRAVLEHDETHQLLGALI